MNDIDKTFENIGKDLQKYGVGIQGAINKLTEKQTKKMVKLTKQTAPRRSGDYRKAITSTFETTEIGDKVGTWGVRPPYYRLTHLLANGHQKRGGGRVKGNPFIEKAYKEVTEEFERDLQGAIDEVKI